MLSTKLLEVKSKLNGIDPFISKKIMATAIGFFTALKTQLPSSQVDNFSKYYDTDLTATAKEVIFKLNEELVIDVDYTCIVAKNYWCVRYNTLYPDMNQIILSTYNTNDIFDKLSGVSFLFSKEDYDFIVEHSKIITEIVLMLE